MKAFIGLGANLGERRATLERAAQGLRALSAGGRLRASPLYENPALVPEGAPLEWRIPYLNGIVEMEWSGEPLALLAELKRLERELGRAEAPRWSPRAIDLDLLALGDLRYEAPALSLPHRDLWRRPFVLDPLKDLAPGFRLPGKTESVLMRARSRPGHAPLWMGILNLTPDSFSDGGRLARPDDVVARLESFERAGAHVIDVGGESTRPGATEVAPDEEWARIASALELLRARAGGALFRPLVSVDTRRASVAERALAAGADWINDVSGLADPRMADVVRERGCEYVLMHSLSVPADRKLTIAPGLDPVAEVKAWARLKFDALERAGVSLDRVLFDPGIGFGKTPAQSLDLLRRAREFLDLPVRVLIGHSRKSFMRLWTQAPPAENDMESVGVSLRLAALGADVLRVHEPQLHIRAHRAYQESGPWNA